MSDCLYPENTASTGYRYGCRCPRCKATQDEWNRTKLVKYSGECGDCGGRTYNASTSPPTKCKACRNEAVHAAAVERALAAIRAWAQAHDGVPPKAMDWQTSATRVVSGATDEPWTGEVQFLFGTWNAAIEAAGYEPKRVSKFTADELDEVCAELRRRYEAGESTVTLAREFDVGVDLVCWRIRRAGGTMRTRSAAQRLRVEREAA